jgi:hypothetical protein
MNKPILISVLSIAIILLVIGIFKEIVGLTIVGIVVIIAGATYKSVSDKYTQDTSIRDQLLEQRSDEKDGLLGKYHGHMYNVHQTRRHVQSDE